MSGTSRDGIDAALVELSRSHGRLRVWQRGFRTFSYPRAVRERLLRLSQGATVNAGEVSQVNFLLGELFARALPDVRVRAVEEVGYDSKALEAAAFAVLAYATLHGLPANVPGATGACEPRVIGKVVPGANYRGTRLG